MLDKRGKNPGRYPIQTRGVTTSMRKLEMSRGDVATEAQTPVDFGPTSMRTLGEPLTGSVQIGVQPGVLPSQPRIVCIQVAVAVTRTRSVCAGMVRSALTVRNVFHGKVCQRNSYAKPSTGLAG